MSAAVQWVPEGQPRPAALGVETNGINVISEAERKGTPRQLFFPWFAANVSVLGLTYGSFVLGFGISFWQAIFAGVIGIIASFLLCGFVAVAGKRGSAPTMILSRAAFGVRGTKLPAFVSWVLCVGWETVLTYLSVEATSTVLQRLGVASGNSVRLAAFVVVAVLIVGAGVLGFDMIMRLQGAITVVTAVLTVMFFALAASKIHWPAVSGLQGGSAEAMIGALVFVMSALGLGWINSAADYSRYLPRSAKASGVIGWTTFGASAAPVLLIIMGLLLAGSSKSLNSAISGSDPIGALAALLPTWFLVPFMIVAVLGLVGGAVLDIYSSGLALLTVGLRAPRWVAAGIDGIIMVAGAIYLVFFSHDFVPKFEGFLTTLAVPISAFGGIMLADLYHRRRPYSETDLYSPAGRYGSVRYLSLGLLVAATVLGWGTVTNTAWGRVLSWQGYLLGPLGLGGKSGIWAQSDLGVVFALGLAFVGWLILGGFTVRAQEADEAPSGSTARVGASR
ncbi:MAG: cytosine permease [Acidimicrobiaceae bacterium]|nr:cytosine permease [Acidimicrobiaceae bacterium]